METIIKPVNPEYIQDLWPLVWPLLKPAVEQSFGIDDEKSLLDRLLKEESFLLIAVVDKNIVGASVIMFREGATKFCDIQFLGGKNMIHWGNEMNNTITELAKLQDCKNITAFGRIAWQRVWKDFKKTDKILFVKEI